MSALTPPGQSSPTIGAAQFDGAQFDGARFDGARFNGNAAFDGVQFSGHTLFRGVQFNQNAVFQSAQFDLSTKFEGARFNGFTVFNGAHFGFATWFDRAQFGGITLFDGAQFSGTTQFSGAHFSENTQFGRVQFDEVAIFQQVKFEGNVAFNGSRFSEPAGFSEAEFIGKADFYMVQFGGGAGFGLTRFNGEAQFSKTKFDGNALFMAARFSRDAHFDEAWFGADWRGPLICPGVLSARRVETTRPVRLQVAANEMVLRQARFADTVVLSVRYARVDLADAATAAPLTVISHPAPFDSGNGAFGSGPAGEEGLSGETQARVVTLSGVDAANLVLTDVDLSECVFSGAYHLDQIRFDGQCIFAQAPGSVYWGWAKMPVRRWTARKVLAEERTWRAAKLPGRSELNHRGWHSPEVDLAAQTESAGVTLPLPSPASLAVLYRQLRKALEDGKDQPGATDFYYGEMEARRHDPATPRGERALLHAYWLLSGYALRASRALGFLAATATITFLLMMAVGLPDTGPTTQFTGTLPAPGGTATLTESTLNPVLTLPPGERFTTARADQAALVVVNSVVFRSSGQDLTGVGTWIEMASRIGEPVLLGFAALAARGRVQR